MHVEALVMRKGGGAGRHAKGGQYPPGQHDARVQPRGDQALGLGVQALKDGAVAEDGLRQLERLREFARGPGSVSMQDPASCSSACTHQGRAQPALLPGQSSHHVGAQRGRQLVEEALVVYLRIVQPDLPQRIIIPFTVLETGRRSGRARDWHADMGTPPALHTMQRFSAQGEAQSCSAAPRHSRRGCGE